MVVVTGRPHVVLGACGGIAAYKAAEVLRGFQKAGLDVRVCMTESATRFVGPLTFAALSGHPVSWGRLTGEEDAGMAHVEVTRDAALFVVAPATANVLARLAMGLADDWLTTHALASEAPLLLAPAMNQRMWRHPAVRQNLTTLQARGAHVVPPGTGDLACGEVGAGRLAEPADIVAAGLALIGRGAALAGRTVLVTSGPTFEDIDPVRFVGNRSSGKMGHALARAAVRRGARVILVTGPVALDAPWGCEVVRVRSAAQMAEAVRSRLGESHVAIFAAAVADFRVPPSAAKIRREGSDSLVLELERTPDVLAECVARRPDAVLVGFAAEVGDRWLSSAREKLARKGCDLLVANRVDGPGSTFDADDAEVVLLLHGGLETPLARAPKDRVAEEILDAATAALGQPRPRAEDDDADVTMPGRRLPGPPPVARPRPRTDR